MKKFAKIYSFILLITLGIFLGVVLGIYTDPVNLSTPTVLFTIFFNFIISLFISIIIHESGHLVFGLCTGYTFESFRILNLMIKKDKNGKLKLFKFSLPGTGGQCLLAPPEMVNNTMPVTLYNLGGVAFNALSAIVCLVIFFATKPVGNSAVILLTFVAVAIYLTLTNGTPLNANGIPNDGYNAIHLKNDPEAMKAMWTMLMVNSRQNKGETVLDMPEEWFYMPSDEYLKNPIICNTATNYCERLMDLYDFEKAEKETSQFLSKKTGLDSINRALLTCQLIYCKSILGKEESEIDSLKTKEQLKFEKALKQFPIVHICNYAYLDLVKKDTKNALKAKDDYAKFLINYPYKSELAHYQKLLEIATEKSDNKHGITY